MKNKAQHDPIGSCDDCGGEIIEMDSFKILSDERMLCPECYEKILAIPVVDLQALKKLLEKIGPDNLYDVEEQFFSEKAPTSVEFINNIGCPDELLSAEIISYDHKNILFYNECGYSILDRFEYENYYVRGVVCPYCSTRNLWGFEQCDHLFAVKDMINNELFAENHMGKKIIELHNIRYIDQDDKEDDLCDPDIQSSKTLLDLFSDTQVVLDQYSGPHGHGGYGVKYAFHNSKIS